MVGFGWLLGGELGDRWEGVDAAFYTAHAEVSEGLSRLLV